MTADREEKSGPLTEVQLMVGRCLLLVERHLEPKCESCGYGVRRPKCAFERGDCPRHDQKDTRAFELVRSKMRKMMGEVPYTWRHDTPLYLLHEYSEDERALLMDLEEMGGVQKTRQQDERFRSLLGKDAVSLSHRNSKYHVELTKRARALLELWRAEQAAEQVQA